jgi:hypothetical protein
MSNLSDCKIIELPKITDRRGNLTVVENSQQIPFDIKRIFYLYDVPGGSSRAGHALINCSQFLVAASGAFDVILDDGTKKEKYHLNRSYYGLYIPPLIWRELKNFSSGSICMVLASHKYNSEDYYRSYDEFLAAAKTLKK